MLNKNLPRRHLSESQRAMVAAGLANITNGDFVGNQQVGSANLRTPPIGIAKAADLVKVSERSVQFAKQVERDAVPELS